MQSYLIVSKNIDFINKKIEKIKTDFKINRFNFHQIWPERSIGIDEVRKIKEIVKLKPYEGTNRLIVIREIEKATLEASNALLKLFEEPSSETYVISTCSSLDQVIPTITSRCQIIMDEKRKKFEDNKVIHEYLVKILKANAGERIFFSKQKITTFSDAQSFLDNLLSYMGFLLHQNTNDLNLSKKEVAAIIKKVTAAQKYLARNVNFKGVVDILLLGLPKL